MNISAKTEYACIALLELAAQHGSGEPVRIRTIAETHGIPSRFLVQILLQLKGAGLVSSTRGASGGYQLIKEPAEITLGEIMDVIEGGPTQLGGCAANETPISRALVDSWQQVDDAQRQMLNAVSLADLLDRVRGQTENMYYI